MRPKPTKKNPLRYPINCFGDTQNIETLKLGGYWCATFDRDASAADGKFHGAGGLESLAKAREWGVGWLTGPGNTEVAWGLNPVPGTGGRAREGVLRDPENPALWRAIFGGEPLAEPSTREAAIKALRVALGLHQ